MCTAAPNLLEITVPNTVVTAWRGSRFANRESYLEDWIAKNAKAPLGRHIRPEIVAQRTDSTTGASIVTVCTFESAQVALPAAPPPPPASSPPAGAPFSLPMTLNEYQELASRTRGRVVSPDFQKSCSGLGIAGEAGEVADMIKKEIYHGHGPNPDPSKMPKELGDVLWYVADLATSYGYTLEEVARMNVAKLQARYPAGFTTADSLARRDDDNGTVH